MTLPKDELTRRRLVAAHKEMRAALSIAQEKATIIEDILGGIHPSDSQKQGLSREQIARELAKSQARRRIPDFPHTNTTRK